MGLGCLSLRNPPVVGTKLCREGNKEYVLFQTLGRDVSFVVTIGVKSLLLS